MPPMPLMQSVLFKADRNSLKARFATSRKRVDFEHIAQLNWEQNAELSSLAYCAPIEALYPMSRNSDTPYVCHKELYSCLFEAYITTGKRGF